MKLIVTADLHYDIARSVKATRRIADEICGLQSDALLILGDAAGRDAGIVNDCLHLFDRFGGRKFFVAGNHDIWTNPGEDSLEKLEKTLPALCREAGFHPLDTEPVIIDGIGLVGSIGWYDFSYRPMWLKIPLRFYEGKIAPGAALRMEKHRHLVADRSDIPDEAMRIGTRWMDGEFIHLPMSDVDFCRRLLEGFKQHLDQIADECEKIVVGLHHIPFSELAIENEKPAWAFGRAFMGSELFGQVMLRYPKIRYALTGHSHQYVRERIAHIECINVGCTYVEKRYEIIEV
ncbi:MAG: metallophosphoesterase [Planctomycetota bacterium]|nr:MAG: metallophosphoesterase [Planctomycetota bacterium]